MTNLLEQINSPKDLKKLTLEEKETLSQEIRDLIIDVTSKNGGHVASNLGVVELTIALHSIFDTPNDKIVWDVGHQCYVHKILTGRREEFQNIRKLGGISGFPKICESEYDNFNTGHSSTSISIATGMARARDILNENYEVVAVIGDGSLTGGMALEALNDAGSSKTNVKVILNDNEMSISKNVGGIPLYLSKMRTKTGYTRSNRKIKAIVNKIPYIGKPIISFAHYTKQIIKRAVFRNMYFEDIGFTYLGPVDGHDIKKLEDILERSKKINGPVLIHVVTKKGKGYKLAEENPDKFHGISAYDKETGEVKKSKNYSKVFGEKLVKMASEDKRIVAVTAAMRDGTGLKEFAEKFPDRFFDVGIAEQHALGLIAGMARAGLKPVLPIYSSFLQRGYDQIIHDIALSGIPVTVCIDRAGIVGNDGETHQGIFDLSFLSSIPNIVIMAPKNFEELDKMLEFGVNLDKPVFIRYPRGGENFSFESTEDIELGKAEIVQEGTDLSIIAIGNMVGRAEEVASLLPEKSVEIINARFLKPLDEETILNSIRKTGYCITIEDNLLKGGLGSAVVEAVNKSDIQDVKIKNFGYDDTFVEHGTVKELEDKYGLSAEKISGKLFTFTEM
jgi:1-deoxy-D-xylulose-5-phosphate synthase